MVPPAGRSVDIRCSAAPRVLEVAAKFLKLKSDLKSVPGGPTWGIRERFRCGRIFRFVSTFVTCRGPGEQHGDRYDFRNQPIKPAVIVGNIKQACESKVRHFRRIKFLSRTTDFP